MHIACVNAHDSETEIGMSSLNFNQCYCIHFLTNTIGYESSYRVNREKWSFQPWMRESMRTTELKSSFGHGANNSKSLKTFAMEAAVVK